MKFWHTVYNGLRLFVNGLITALTLWFINFIVVLLGFSSFLALIQSDNTPMLIFGMIIAIALLIVQFFISGAIGQAILKIK